LSKPLFEIDEILNDFSIEFKFLSNQERDNIIKNENEQMAKKLQLEAMQNEKQEYNKNWVCVMSF